MCLVSIKSILNVSRHHMCFIEYIAYIHIRNKNWGFATKNWQSTVASLFTFQSHNTLLHVVCMVSGLVNFKTNHYRKGRSGNETGTNVVVCNLVSRLRHSRRCDVTSVASIFSVTAWFLVIWFCTRILKLPESYVPLSRYWMSWVATRRYGTEFSG